MDNAKITRLSVPSSLKHVHLAGQAVRDMLREILPGEETVFLMELAVCEAVSNCVKHAYENRAGNQVEVEVMLENNEIVIKVMDQGKELCPKLLENSKLPETCNIESLQEGGRGLPIINQIMDHVDYRSSSRKNILTMKKSICRSDIAGES